MGLGYPLGKQQERLTALSLYCPNPGGDNSDPTTVWAQQRVRMQEIATDRDEVSNADPRTACLKEFQNWANDQKNKGDKLVVLADANQSLTDTKETYNLKDLVELCKFTRKMQCKHPGESLKSLDRGSKTIDHVLVSGIEDNKITQASQLPFGLGFHTYNRGEFADMNGESMLKIIMEEPKEQQGRCL